MDENQFRSPRPESQPPMVCPKCGGNMSEGFLPDYTYGTVLEQKWVEGAVEKRGLFGTIKVRGKVQFRLSTYRCDNCGFLESYADKPAE